MKRVLEVGCGIGAVSSYLLKKYKWNITGIDLDPEQIEKAEFYNEESENLQFIEADVKKIPFENKEFDIILSFDVMHHIPEWNKALNEINRVLKPTGFYLLRDLTLPKVSARIFKKWGVFGMSEIINHLKRRRFKIIYEEKPKIKIPTMKHFILISEKNY